MSSVNKVILIGNVGKDPVIRDTKTGGKMASFSVATSDRFKNKEGERVDTTDWHNVVVFNENLVKIVADFVRKGSKVYVEGAQKTRKWTNKEGRDVWVTEVVLGPFRSALAMLDKSEGNRPAPADSAESYGIAKPLSEHWQENERQEQAGRGQQQIKSPSLEELDDEIPF